MSLKLKIYTGVVIGAAISLLIYLYPSLYFPPNIWLVLTFFITLYILDEFLQVNFSYGAVFNISFPLDLTIILIFGPAFAIFITLISQIFILIFTKKSEWYKSIFNIAQYILSVGIAGIIYQRLGGVSGEVNFISYLIPIIGSVIVYFLINTYSVFIAIYLEGKISIISLMKDSIENIVNSVIGLTPIGFAMAMIYASMSILGVILYLFPLFLARRAFELYIKSEDLEEKSVNNKKSNLEEVIDKKTRIFLSYSHSNTDIADKIDNFFNSKNISLTRDVRDLVPYSSLEKFMDTIRDHDYVIILISNAFLKSVNCMYEVIQFIQEKKCTERTFPIIIDEEIQIFNRSRHIEYIRYWQKEYISLETRITSLRTFGILSLYKELNKIERIQSNIGDFLDKIANLNCVSLEELESTDYQAIIDKINKFTNSIQNTKMLN
ncbi:toll/interleukin-1 receptor domain-containing protein [bacterium]|nr:toll/interleukin-1 receptor domain-containing protein [bacterium]MBU4510186.1 toll/interleukin-1 receptor domain-containing protein [bacterium]